MSDYEKLRAAVERLYFAAYWKADRECDDYTLWADVRDAAGSKMGQSIDVLGPPQWK